MRFFGICLLVVGACLMSCNNGNQPGPNTDYVVGQNYYTTIVDGDVREYFVHVPVAFNARVPVPVVVMMHGGSQTGQTMYNSSGWKEVGDSEHFLTVFPTAWSYCWIRANGSKNDTTRWNSLPGIFEFCPGEEPRDDVKFMRQMLDELQTRFNLDTRRIYMVGYSSGAQMTFRCAIEMSDVLAAGVQVAATHQPGTTLRPLRNMPVAFELGNQDETWFDEPYYPPLTLFDTLLQSYVPFTNVIEVHARTFQYDTTYVLTDNGMVTTATFASKPAGEDREFRFTLIDSLGHAYPNTVNHPYPGARIHWEWLRQFTLQ